VLLAEVAAEGLILRQLDVTTSFLNGDLEEDIYMEPPEGLPVRDGEVCKLRKSLYGLRQAPRAWHTKLKTELQGMHFRVSDADPGLFVYENDGMMVWILVYVDDILVAARTANEVDFFVSKFLKKFDARELGDATYFLGLEIQRDATNGTIKLSQTKYATELVSKYGLLDANATSTPSSTSVKMTKEGDPLDLSVFPFREAVGGLLYLAVCTRPDIAQAVGAVARYMSAPTTQHWSAVKMILRYIKGTAALGLVYGSGEPGLAGYCDADYAGDVDTRRSTTGYVFILNGGAISYSSQLQPTVAASTVEAEYMSAARAVKEALWLRKLLPELGMKTPTVKIWSDNQGALKLLKNPITSARSKHIDVQHHFARERVSRGEVEFNYVSTHGMVADILTKALPANKVKMCRNAMGLS
jgi:hypothetical protein